MRQAISRMLAHKIRLSHTVIEFALDQANEL